METTSPVTTRATRLGKSLIVLLWLLLFGLVGIAGLEFFVKVRVQTQATSAEHTKPRYQALYDAYQPFTIQYIHPMYLFFFPFDLKERSGINNAVCSVNDDGFRGPGVGQLKDRKLAFLLGGSAAFGHFATSDSTTITGYLNRIQSEYFFVNAGVPSWNSTQEMYRLMYQLLEYKPALVITYDGSNDIAILVDYWEKGIYFPPGTPESFEKLDELVSNIRANDVKLLMSRPLHERLFPRLTKRIRSYFHPEGEEKQRLGSLPDDLIEKAAEKYSHDLSFMNSSASGNGTRFIGIFQPNRRYHKHVDRRMRELVDLKYYEKFHEFMFGKYKPQFEYHDFSDIFDSQFTNVPSFDNNDSRDLIDDMIFVDAVHISDRGNQLVAERISNLLNKQTSHPAVASRH